MKISLFKSLCFAPLFFGLLHCAGDRKKDDAEPVIAKKPVGGKKVTQPDRNTEVHVLTAQDLLALGWKLPTVQHLGDEIPPQVGDTVLPPAGNTRAKATKVKLHGHDLPWSASTLLLYRDDITGEIEILTQKRASHMSAPGTIETAGGHLTAGLSWRKGALDETNQETGINPTLLKDSDFIYVNSKGPMVQMSRAGVSSLVGHMNFVVVFAGQKPAANGRLCPEIDHTYGQDGHVWQKLGDEHHDLYKTILEEQRDIAIKHPRQWFKDGTYYGNFRGHLFAFGKNFLGWPDR